MSTYSSQLQEEQDAVDRAYGRLDDLRTRNRARLDAVRAAGSHGSPTQRTERDSFASMYEDRLAQLRAVEDRLVFGRLDHRDGLRRYIGRIGLSSQSHEPILTDWRAEAARPFYEATPSAHGDIVMRRHISLSFRTVTGIEDEVLDLDSPQVGQAASQGTLAGEGALLATLSSRRTGRMTDIVATIQAEQDRIIRSDMAHTVVVQGGPGTGKTAVALHRAAYLLYTHRSVLERSGVLVVGPSPAFLRYIDQVLPSLGETGVLSRTIGDLIPGVVAKATDTPHVAKLKGDPRMASVIARAVHSRERVPANLPRVSVEGVSVPMLAVDVEQALADARRTHQPHNKARETFARSMLQSLENRYTDSLDYTPGADELGRARSLLRLNDQVRKAINLAWLPMEPAWLLENLWSHPALLARLAPWLRPEEVDTLTRPKGSPLTISDIPLLDEAMELLGPDPRQMARLAARDAAQAQERHFAQDTLAQNGIGTGLVNSQMLLDNINGLDAQAVSQKAAEDREWVFGHIVVDEAQELTAMDWRMLLRRCPSRSFTIVGDVAQTSALGGTRSWQRTMDRLFGEDGWELNELTIDYRNPREVSELAADHARAEGLHVSTVRAVRTVPGSVRRIRAQDSGTAIEEASRAAADLAQEFIGSDGAGRVAVISSADQVTALMAAVRKVYRETVGDKTADRLAAQDPRDQQLSITSAQEAKGLEYDAVVLVDPERIADEAPSRLVAVSDMYVAMTRPTQRLVIVETGTGLG
ncbi:HelD family protein [Bifidobacterium xylocopae]|uniref:ATP-dependent DNA helicase n=1 Tax=Bifidobacterium xylocopae TaxID=2493119 RepID=A0A366KBQ6_9BIFI|nr:AAA family ATPase [Bifidobacterium xylocopae]RBP99166.1 ATP-dependent DNA helicase [Bifidobacterium xylocopae]